MDMLTDPELQWLNDYNRTVFENLHELMKSTFPESVEYLLKETAPLTRN